MLGEEEAHHHQQQGRKDRIAAAAAAHIFLCFSAHGLIHLNLLHVLIVLDLPLLLQQSLALYCINCTIFLLISLALYNYFSSLAVLALLMFTYRLSKSSTDLYKFELELIDSDFFRPVLVFPAFGLLDCSSSASTSSS